MLGGGTQACKSPAATALQVLHIVPNINTKFRSGLAFLGLGLGSLITIASEPLIRQMLRFHKKDINTGKSPPEAGIAVVCIAAVLMPAGQFWFAWTALPPIHWIWPILAGIPYGMGATASFVYATNYLGFSYGIFVASVMIGNTIWRGVLGGCLPLAGPAMYKALGVEWAASLLDFFLVATAPVPFIFHLRGPSIRHSSKVIQYARQEEARLAGTARA